MEKACRPTRRGPAGNDHSNNKSDNAEKCDPDVSEKSLVPRSNYFPIKHAATDDANDLSIAKAKTPDISVYSNRKSDVIADISGGSALSPVNKKSIESTVYNDETPKRPIRIRKPPQRLNL